MRRKSKLPQTVDNSSSDSSDSDSSLEPQTASDVINSFINPSQTVSTNIPKSRKASDVINSFLQKNKIVDQANHSQFNSALDVINSYLKKDKFPVTRTSTRLSVPRHRERESSDDSTSGSKSELVTRKRVRVVSSTSDSDSTVKSNIANVPKRRRIGNQSYPETAANTDRDMENAENGYIVSTNDSAANEESQPSTTTALTPRPLRKRPTMRKQSTIEGSKTGHFVKPKQNATEMLKVSFTREVYSKQMNTRRIVEQHTVIKDHEIPKEKYDRAVTILNATECRYDETPVDYSVPKSSFDVRRCCNSRRHAEATYDTARLGTSVPISLTRIVTELDNCLKRENWHQMAELIYLGCGLMKTEQTRRAIGTSFFTYALLLLILDSTPDSISTLDGKKDEITKFLIALGNEPEESEEFLKELNLVMDGDDTSNDLPENKSEVE